MRKRTVLEPRLMALSEAELAAQRKSRSWIPQSAARAQQESYRRMVDIWTRQRTVH